MRYIFTFYVLRKVLLLNKNKKRFKIVFWDLCNFLMPQVTQIILKNDKSIYIFGLSFFTFSAKDAKSKFTSVPSIFSRRVQKTEKAILLPFFPFFDLIQKRKKQYYFRFLVFSFLYKKRKKAILLPFFRFSFVNKKRKKQLLYKYSLPVFPVLRKWNERNGNGDGRNGDGLRCEGGGGGASETTEKCHDNIIQQTQQQQLSQTT